jgi:hypothetical protein
MDIYLSIYQSIASSISSRIIGRQREREDFQHTTTFFTTTGQQEQNHGFRPKKWTLVPKKKNN